MLPELKELLRKYKENSCTAEELARVKRYFADRKYESYIKRYLQQDLENFTLQQSSSVPDFSKIFKSIESRIDDSQIVLPSIKKRRSPVRQILRIAAILIPSLILGGIASYYIFDRKPDSQVIAYNEIRTPLGAHSEVVLPDGSTVWLNAGSTLRYMNVFNHDNRDIILTGEGYFKVAKNPALPFNVKTGDLNIRAVGTEFNVKSYDDEGIIETTLVEGKIMISQNKKLRKSIYLEPNQKAVYVKNNKKLTIEDLRAVRETKPEVLKLKKGIIYIAEKVDPVPIVSWKDNRLILKGEELSNLLIKLERRYDVKFIFESESLKQFRFTGTLENETLTQVLDFIKLSAPIDYDLQGKTVIISENKQMTKKFSNHMKKK
ncbi:MAG TPA: FecR family protein [Bacteroidales bacterium]|nr:FecR family protein [Bacteroidales bacterium]